MGLLLDIFNQFTKPARDAAELSNVIRQAANVKRVSYTSDKKTGKVIPSGNSGFSNISQYKPVFTSTKEAQSIADNPELQGSKDIANTMSWLIPAGGAGKVGMAKVGSMAKTGVLQGAVGGYGASDQGKELESILSGGVAGGVIGGGLGLANEGLNRILGFTGKSSLADIANVTDDKLDDYVRNLGKYDKEILKTQMKTTSFYNKGLGEIDDLKNYIKLRSTYERAGVPMPSDPTSALQTSSDVLAKRIADKKTLLSKYPQGLDIDDKSMLINEIRDLVNKDPLTRNLSGKQQTMLNNYISDIMGANTTQELDDIAMNAYGNIKKFAIGNKTASEKISGNIAKTIREKINLVDPAIPQVNADVHGLLDMMDVMQPQAKLAQKELGVGGLIQGGQLPFSATPTVYKGINKVAQGAEKVSATTRPLFDLLAEGITSAKSGKAGGALTKLLPLLGGTYQGMEQQPQEEALQPVEQPYIGASSGNGLPKQMSLIQALAIASKLAPKATIAQQSALAKMLLEDSQKSSGTQGGFITVKDVVDKGVTPGKMTEGDKSWIQARVTLDDAEQFLKDNKGASGKLANIGGKTAEFFGSPTANSAYRTKLANVITSVKKAYLGTAQTAIELKNVEFPKPTDEPKIAAQKIKSLIDQINNMPLNQ